MTHHEFAHILNSLNSLSPDQMRRLRRELDNKLAATAATQPDADPIMGMWRDDAELIDHIVDEAMRNRHEQPWRLPAGE